MFNDLPKFVFLTGKGGVGKTSMAAAVAVELASRGHEVLLTATDPAAHLTEMLTGEVPHLTVSRIDPAQTNILTVTLPETAPVLEAARLQEHLRRAEITPSGWVMNASLTATGTTQPVLADRAATEAPEIAKVQDDLTSRYAVVEMQAGDPAGTTRLRALVGGEPALM